MNTKLRISMRSFTSITLSVLIALLFVAVSVHGATTISTNINTGGTLAVTSTTASSTIQLLWAEQLQVGTLLETTYINATSTSATSTFAGGFAIETSGFLYDFTTNRIGIGTTSPGVMLSVAGDIVGNILAVDQFRATSTTATSTIAGGFAIETSGFLYDFTTNRIGVATTSPSATVSISNKEAEDAFAIGSSTDTTFIVDKAENVGIGTSSPSYKFSADGDAMFFSGATTTIKAHSSATGVGGCIELKGTDDAVYHIYATTTGPAWITAGGCQEG